MPFSLAPRQMSWTAGSKRSGKESSQPISMGVVLGQRKELFCAIARKSGKATPWEMRFGNIHPSHLDENDPLLIEKFRPLAFTSYYHGDELRFASLWTRDGLDGKSDGPGEIVFRQRQLELTQEGKHRIAQVIPAWGGYNQNALYFNYATEAAGKPEVDDAAWPACGRIGKDTEGIPRKGLDARKSLCLPHARGGSAPSFGVVLVENTSKMEWSVQLGIAATDFQKDLAEQVHKDMAA